ncbi:MAG: hypothetical protein EXQ70_03170 [Solirubrobacterales bacterium]|nr:hypothetical protein [Solirubrobacterales bacterium]
MIVALSGTAVAARLIDGGDVRNNSLTGKDVKNLKGADVTNQSLGGADISNGSLGTGKFSSSIPAARVTDSDGQSIDTGVVETLNFDSERYDTANMHDNSTNNFRLTAPVTGIYAVTGQVGWDTANDTRRALLLRKNGSTDIAIEQAGAVLGDANVQELTTQVQLQEGDYVEARVLMVSGTTPLNIFKSNEFSPEFSMTWLAPGP